MIATSLTGTMIQCTQCGQGNADNAHFCRFCGDRLVSPQNLPYQERGPDQKYAPPRPYAWKTDEYQTQPEQRIYPPDGNRFAAGQQIAYPAASHFATASYRCPNCGTSTLPLVERRISTAGWITFALLLVFTFIFFWIGLLIREDVTVCPVCRARLQ